MKTSVGLRWLLAVLILAGFAASSLAQSPPELKPSLDAIVSRHMGAGALVGLEIGIINNGGQPQSFDYGEVIRRSGQMPSPSTLFQIGSITKTFTGVLLALLVERGIVHFDDPLQKYVPFGVQVPSYNNRQILLLDLATHTSGLPRNAPTPMRQKELSLNGMYALLNRTKLTTEPAKQYSYSNWGSALLAEALVRATKADDYQSLLEREVLSKLGMGETTVRPNAEAEAKIAQGYAESGFPAVRMMPTWPAFNGAGALYSTGVDMSKYLSFNLGLMQTSLNSVLRVVHQPMARGLKPSHNVALGWEIHQYPRSNRTIVEKLGGTPGFKSYIGFIQGEQTGVVILANSVATESAAIGQEILALLARKPEPRGPLP